MPDWLIEGDSTIYLLLAAVGVIAAVAWWQMPKKWLLAVATVAFAMIGVLFLLDRQFESDREQIGRKLNEMAAAVTQPPDMNKIFTHVSADFRYGPADKAQFRKFCDQISRGREVREMKVWDYRVKELSKPRKRTEITFQFKVKAAGTGIPEEAFYRCDATYALDPDGQWRLLTFKVFPLTGGDSPLRVPGLD